MYCKNFKKVVGLKRYSFKRFQTYTPNIKCGPCLDPDFNNFKKFPNLNTTWRFDTKELVLLFLCVIMHVIMLFNTVCHRDIWSHNYGCNNMMRFASKQLRRESTQGGARLAMNCVLELSEGVREVVTLNASVRFMYA